MKKNYSLILRKIIFAFNSISVIGIAIFILYTTRKICDAYVASDFLEKVNAIPANPSALVGEILVLVAIMGISFICREKFVRENTGGYYLTLLIHGCIIKTLYAIMTHIRSGRLPRMYGGEE